MALRKKVTFNWTKLLLQGCLESWFAVVYVEESHVKLLADWKASKSASRFIVLMTVRPFITYICELYFLLNFKIYSLMKNVPLAKLGFALYISLHKLN